MMQWDQTRNSKKEIFFMLDFFVDGPAANKPILSLVIFIAVNIGVNKKAPVNDRCLKYLSEKKSSRVFD